MPNMSYCRFENTYSDLRDCYEAMDDTEKLSLDEQKYRKRIIALCCTIAAEYSEPEDEQE